MNRNFDKLGRLVIPKEMRTKLGFEDQAEVKIELIGNSIIITNPNNFNVKEFIEEKLKNDVSEETQQVLFEILKNL